MRKNQAPSERGLSPKATGGVLQPTPNGNLQPPPQLPHSPTPPLLHFPQLHKEKP
jgi:hypothetical protein